MCIRDRSGKHIKTLSGFFGEQTSHHKVTQNQVGELAKKVDQLVEVNQRVLTLFQPLQEDDTRTSAQLREVATTKSALYRARANEVAKKERATARDLLKSEKADAKKEMMAARKIENDEKKAARKSEKAGRKSR